MKTKNTALATAIALSLATGGFLTSSQVWADTSTRTLQTVIDRQVADDGFIYVTAGETINLSMLGLDQYGKLDTLGEQYGAIIFAAVNTNKGEIFEGSNTPGEREENTNPLFGQFAMDPPQEKPFNNLKYVRLEQGAGRVFVYYPPTVNTPPIVDKTGAGREYDECCFLPCGDKIPPDQLYCPDDDRTDMTDLPPVDETITVTLQERFANKAGGVEYKVINSVEKKIKILPYLPRVKQLEVMKVEAVAVGTRSTREKNVTLDSQSKCSATQVAAKKCDDDANDGINNVEMTAGAEVARITIWALRDDPSSATGLAKDRAANGKVKLKLMKVGSRELLLEVAPVDMLNGEVVITAPIITLAGKFYIEAELTLAVNGAIDPTSDLALPTTANNVGMFTADMLTVKDTGKPRKLLLESVKKVISDDANNTPFNAGAAWNASTIVRAYVLDEYGNKTALPPGLASKVKVTDSTGVLNAGSLNLDIATDPGRKIAKDAIGDAFGDVLRLGEASLVATIDGVANIQSSDALKIKVVSKNLVASPYVGSGVQGDMAYGDVAGIPAANQAYPSVNRYFPNTTNVIKDIQVGTLVKAFSVGVDGGRQPNGLPNGLFDFYKSPVDGAILPNLVDGTNSDDDFVSRNSSLAMTVKTWSDGDTVETVEATVNPPIFNPDATVAEVGQADGTRGQGARLEATFTKPVKQMDASGNPSYFIIGDKAGLYGETIVYLPGTIKPSAAATAKLLNAHGYEEVVIGPDGKPVLDENGNPVIKLDPRMNHPNRDGSYQVVIPKTPAKPGEHGGVSIADGQGNPLDEYGNVTTPIPSTSNGSPSAIVLDEYGNSLTSGVRSVRQVADCATSTTTDPGSNIPADVLSYNSDEFSGTDRVSLNFTGSIKPRTIEVTIPPKPKLTTIKVEVEQTVLPVNSIVAVTFRSFDQNGFAIDALKNTTVNFSGTILPTATVWRLEDEVAKKDQMGIITNWEPTRFVSSGDVVRPTDSVNILDANGVPMLDSCGAVMTTERYAGGDQQVFILNIGNKAGEFSMTFNHPDLAEPQKVTFKAVEVYNAPEVCGSVKPELCTTEEDCTSAGGGWKDSQCEFAAVPLTAEACDQQGGIYAGQKCYLAVDSTGVPTKKDVAQLKAASSMDGGSYGDAGQEDANFFGGVMVTGSSGDDSTRITNVFGNPVDLILGDSVNVSGVIKVEDMDKGKKADIVVAALHTCKDVTAGCPEYPKGAMWYMMVQCSGNDFVTFPTCPSFGWKIQPWESDENGYPILSYLQPLTSVVLPGIPGDSTNAYKSVDMYKGNFIYPADPDAMLVYFGYVVTEGVNAGKVVYNDQSININIKVTASGKTDKTDKTTGK